MKSTKLLFPTLIIALLFSGCKNKKTEDDIITPAPALYKEGIDFLEQQKYSKAAEEFGKVFYQHPGNDITPQAELMQAYALYLASNYEEGVDILEMFIKLHPLHKDIAYAYYLKALCYYMEISNIQLDQSRTIFAKESFEEVISLFPKTKYAIDAALKIDLVNDHLAGKEMDVGRYYLRKNNPIAAINRFQLVVNNYQTTSHVSEALYRLIESYLMLGLTDDTKRYTAVLGHNYPESNWYKYGHSLVKSEKE